jgi:hypothetical protein
MTGEPHFRCKDSGDDGAPKWEVGFDLVHDETLKSKLETLYSTNGFCSQDAWKTSPENYELLGKLIIEAKAQNSSLSQYFTDLKQDSQKRENDRVYQGLLTALNTLNAN